MSGLEKRVGNGSDTGFWDEFWVGERPLKVSFTRLYNLCLDRFSRVSEMGVWRDGEWAWVWNWRRNLFDRENVVLCDLINLINMHPLNSGAADEWRWKWESDGHYSTKGAYLRLLQQKLLNRDAEKEEYKRVWNKFAQTKVRIHAWESVMGKKYQQRQSFSDRSVFLTMFVLTVSSAMKLWKW